MLDAVDAVLVRELQRDGRATSRRSPTVWAVAHGGAARACSTFWNGVVRVVGIVHAPSSDRAPSVMSRSPSTARRGTWSTPSPRSAAWFAALATGPARRRRARYASATTRRSPQEVDAVPSAAGVRGVEVFRVISVVKDAHAVVPSSRDVSLDEIDWRLLRELHRDGRTPYTRLADGRRPLPGGDPRPGGTAHALRRHPGERHRRPAALGAGELGGFGRWSPAGSKVAEAVAAQDGVRYLATGFGRYDIVGAGRGDLPQRAGRRAGRDPLGARRDGPRVVAPPRRGQGVLRRGAPRLPAKRVVLTVFRPGRGPRRGRDAGLRAGDALSGPRGPSPWRTRGSRGRRAKACGARGPARSCG